jgi:four helix bundle protein
MSKYILEDLEVYKLSIQSADEIWDEVIKWDYIAKDTIGKQIIKASDSIAANIAEGYGRYSYNENKHFCFYSRGSILETKTWLLKAKNRNLINENRYNELINELEIIHRKLNAYMKFIGNSSKKSTNEQVNK